MLKKGVEMQYLIGGIIGFLLCMAFSAAVYFIVKAKVAAKRVTEMNKRDERWREDIRMHYERMENQWARIANSLEWMEVRAGEESGCAKEK